jgi:hypothetical protein
MKNCKFKDRYCDLWVTLLTYTPSPGLYKGVKLSVVSAELLDAYPFKPPLKKNITELAKYE